MMKKIDDYVTHSSNDFCQSVTAFAQKQNTAFRLMMIADREQWGNKGNLSAGGLEAFFE